MNMPVTSHFDSLTTLHVVAHVPRLTRIRSTTRQTLIRHDFLQPDAAYHRPGRSLRDDRCPCLTSTCLSIGHLEPALLCGVAPQSILSAYPATNGGRLTYRTSDRPGFARRRAPGAGRACRSSWCSRHDARD